MKNIIFTILLFLLTSCPVLAEIPKVKYGLGFSYNYININNKNFDYVNKYETLKNPKYQTNNFNINTSLFYKNINLSLSTNRIFAKEIKRFVKRKIDGKIFENKTRTKIDSLILSYKINKFNPGIIFANVKVTRYLLFNSKIIEYQNKNSIVSGANLGYFINKNFIGSITYILPNNELNIANGISLNINYLF